MSGGEDDLVALWRCHPEGLELCARGEAHTSWVTQVAFHSRHGKRYRFASVGLDAKLCVWELLADDYEGVWDVHQEGGEGSDAPTWWRVPRVEPLSVDGVGADPLSDLIIQRDHLVTCCVTGTMHIWFREEQPKDAQDDVEDRDQAGCSDTRHDTPAGV